MGFNVSTRSMMASNSSPSFLSLFTSVTCKFKLDDDDVIDVCRIEDVKEVSNSTPA
jgi:hypothetical protein